MKLYCASKKQMMSLLCISFHDFINLSKCVFGDGGHFRVQQKSEQLKLSMDMVPIDLILVPGKLKCILKVIAYRFMCLIYRHMYVIKICIFQLYIS